MAILDAHRPRTAALTAALCLALAGVGCSSSGGDETGAGGAAGTGGGAGGPAVPDALAFESSGTLTLFPGETGTLALTATPPDVYVVRFALLGDYKDASLDKSEVSTAADGTAEVLVTAPTAATTFSVRASVQDSVFTTAGVSVSASGFATLQVVPSYGGQRSVSHWVASARTGVTCADLSADPTSDGDLKATAPAGQVPQIDGVPVGPALAITLRGGHSVAGCLDVTGLTAGETNEISVNVSDLPMQLEQTDLKLVLGLDAPKDGLGTLLDPSAVTSALVAAATNDVSALLEQMQESTATDQEASDFLAARKAGGWDQALSAALGPSSPQAIRDLALPWLVSGVAALPSSDTLRARLISAGKLPGQAQVELEGIGTADAASAGVAPVSLATWKAEPGDTVLLGTTLFLLPSRLVTALATAPAKSAAPGSSSVPEALAELLDCGTVATTLVAAGASTGEAYAGCDATCAEALCAAALERMWERAADASVTDGSGPASIAITATAAAVVDDEAAPVAFDGSWVGSFTSALGSVSVGGSASGAKPPPPR